MEFVSIRTATLRGDQQIQFDVYVMVAGKHIIFLRKGDSFEGERLQRLKEKKVKKLFIRTDEEKAYMGYVTENIDKAYDKTTGPIEKRAEVIQGVQQSSAEAVLESPEDRRSYSLAKDSAGRYVEFLLKEEKAVRAMLSIENANRDLAQHGVTVSTLSVAIANRIGLNDPAQMQLLALGALLHDFGHTDMKYPFFKPMEELAIEVRLQYSTHPQVGMEAVQIHKHFDPAVISIIGQHEETIDGNGYPNRLREREIDPLAVIVSTANDFDRLMLNEKLSREDAIKKFIATRVGLHPVSQLQAISSLLSNP